MVQGFRGVAVMPTCPSLPQSRCEHHTDHGYSLRNQRDIDGVLATAVDEFLCAVERINKKKSTSELRWYLTCRGCLLGHNHVFRPCLAQCADNHRLGGMIGDSHRAGIGFDVDINPFVCGFEYRAPCA